ncbi:M28 family peptidase [uncultured Imperialibacter sp.]|uniref:M28 family peptidase n=1 Tax=uncultured Imperialibacter sp. TaxID=1672639 RepID=UPI0030DA93D1|tara:strand:- start:4437 stop:6158 length:1722 start_codon:yes stop_codon:yes gene_type:complete
MKNIALFPLTFILLSCAQPTTETPNPSSAYFDLVRPEVTGDLAYETTAYVEQFWRLAGNTGFDSSIYRIVSELQRAGYVPEENATKDNRLVYRIEKRALSKPTWEPVNGELSIKGDASPLLSFATNRNMLPIYSTSTPEAGIGGEVVFVEDIEGIAAGSLKGKIALADANPRQAFEQAVQKGGALALLTYNNPDYLQPEKNVTSIQFRSIPYQEGKDAWCVALSWEAREKLKNAMAKGKTELNIKINTKIYPSEELTVVANVRGSQVPDERLVFSAHVQEPGANDNASGTGTQVEMAAVTAKLMKENKFDPKRTITFLWGDEIVSTRRYIEEDSLRASHIKWGISLDMVGENTAVTGGSFLIEKMPDPSAIWTRGNDKHTEWGAGDVTMADMKPHYFNDFILNRFLEQGTQANWQVSYNPFEGGSDHVPFLEANIPGLLLWHFTDQFYHTDNDRLDKVSKATEKNVATAALASAFTLVNADHQTALSIISEIKNAATNRLNAEAELSKQAVKDGASASEETQILSAWADWYVKALGSVKDMEVGGASTEVTEAIEASQKEIQKLLEEIIKQLR